MITEKRVRVSVEVFEGIGGVNVRWEDQILRDGEVISRTPVPRGYTRDERDMFVADMESPANGGEAGQAAPYLAILGWEVA